MKIEHVHFFVEDAQEWRNWFIRYLGFQRSIRTNTPYLGEFLSPPHTNTEVVTSGAIRFLLSSPLLPTSPVADYLKKHPPGVADIAFSVDDIEAILKKIHSSDVQLLQPLQEYQQGKENIKWCKIPTWGSLSHTLIEKVTPLPSSPSPFTAIDHIVLNVPAGELTSAIAWYQQILDFQPQQVFKIKTERSGLYSQVMVSRDGNVQFPINEPSSPNSQIQEFLEANQGAGIQHIALRTTNLVNAIAQFRAWGLPLLSVPKSYYEKLQQRPGIPINAAELEAISQQKILVDWKEDPSPQRNTSTPLLLQIFTQPIFSQPTFFFEFIERRFQIQGFGEGNFRALFEAIENEQLKRGRL